MRNKKKKGQIMHSATKQTRVSLNAMMSPGKQGAVKEYKQKFIDPVLILKELKSSTKTLRENLLKTEDDITQKELKLKPLQVKCDIDKIVDEVQNKPEKSKALLEKLHEDKQETLAAIELLLKERKPLQRENDELVQVLNHQKWLASTLFKLSTSFEAHDAQKEQKPEPERTTITKSVEQTWSSTADPMVTLLHSDTVVSKCDVERDDEEKLEMYFSDPQEVIDSLTTLRDQNLSLIHNSPKVDEMREETIKITTKKMKEDQEKFIMQEKVLKDRIVKTEKSAATLERMVQLHNFSQKEDQDVLLAALDKKVKDLYSSTAEGYQISLSTLDRLCSVEKSMTLLLQQVESIPEDVYKAIWHVKENEKKSRMREEKLRLEREKEEKQRLKCHKRAFGNVKKMTVRKPMPRIQLVKKKRAKEPVADTVEEDTFADFFSDN